MAKRKAPTRTFGKKWIVIGALLCAALAATIFFTVSFHPASNEGTSTKVPQGSQEATYITSSAPNSSQWLILNSASSPQSISANNTGTIDEYTTLAALNQTRIGMICVSVRSSGACSDFRQFLETGWYWNSTAEVLYIHYVGGSDVEITVYLKSASTS